MSECSQTRNLTIIFVACVLCYINSLNCGLVYDDDAAVAKNRDLLPETPILNLFFNDFWGDSLRDPKSHGSYRPLCTLTYRWNYYFTKLEPAYFHLGNVFFHASASLLAYWCLLVLSFSTETSFIGGLLFAVHPIHTEAVTGVVGRAELLAAIFYFLAIICYVLTVNGRGFAKVALLFMSAASIPLATLSKEAGITVAGTLIFYEILTNIEWEKNRMLPSLCRLANVGPILRLLAIAVSTIALLAIRLKLMPRLPVFSDNDNPAAFSETPIRQLTFAYLVPLNAFLFLYPWPLSADWSMTLIPLIKGFNDWRNLITLSFFFAVIGSAIACLRRSPTDRKFVFCLAAMAIPFIPASNLFFHVGFVIAERVLYLPSFGWCALIAMGYERFQKRFKNEKARKLSNLISLAMLLLVVSFSCRSYVRNYDWVDTMTVFRSGIRFQPKQPKVYFGVGIQYENNFKWHEALAYFHKTVQIKPTGFNRAHRSIARMFFRLNKTEWVEKTLRHLIGLVEQFKEGQQFRRVDVQILKGSMELIEILMAKTPTYARQIELEHLLGFVSDIDEAYLTGYHRRADILHNLSRFDEAYEMYKRPINFYKKCGECYYGMALVSLYKSPKDDNKILKQVLENLRTALKYDPNHYYAMHAFALIVQERHFEQHYDHARKLIARVIDYEKETNRTLEKETGFGLTVPESFSKNWDSCYIAAMLENETGNFEKALEFFKAASERNSNQSEEILIKLAWLLYRDLSRPDEALKYVEKILEINPNKTNAWILLGYYHLQHTENVEKAREAFEMAVEVVQFEADPSKHVSLIAAASLELCSLFKADKTSEAVSCLESLAQQYPPIAPLLKTLKKFEAQKKKIGLN